jgi:hypothetical protein
MGQAHRLQVEQHRAGLLACRRIDPERRWRDASTLLAILSGVLAPILQVDALGPHPPIVAM